jgi:16S rRNA (uracil1498-N3)-methyltransferase
MTTSAPRIAARLHVDAPLDAGAIQLDAERTHYLRNVLRLQPGARVAVFNARDGEFEAELVVADKRGCRLERGARRRTPTVADEEPDLWLCFAPIKRARLDAMVEKATELGASRLVPVLTRHTNMERVNIERLCAIAIEAAEQSERLTVPEVASPVTLAALLAQWPATRTLIVGDETGGGAPILSALGALHLPAGVLIGPEGGFAREEIELLARHDRVRRVGLGPRILRADTAAIAMLSILQASIGDGARPPRFQAAADDP